MRFDRDRYAAGAWDFDQLNVGLTEGRRVSDLDGQYHHDGHFLLIETKRTNHHQFRDGDGQLYALRNWAHKPGVVVIVLWSARNANGGRDPVDEVWIIRPVARPIKRSPPPDSDGWDLVIGLRDRVIIHADSCDHPHTCSFSLRFPPD